MRDDDDTLSALQRTNKLLALMAVKDSETKEAVLLLKRAGYTQTETAALLGMKPNAVGMILVRHRRAKPAKRAKKAVRNGTDG